MVYIYSKANNNTFLIMCDITDRVKMLSHMSSVILFRAKRALLVIIYEDIVNAFLALKRQFIHWQFGTL